MKERYLKVLRAIKPGHPLIRAGFFYFVSPEFPAPAEHVSIGVFHYLEWNGLIELAFEPEPISNDLYDITDKGRKLIEAAA